MTEFYRPTYYEFMKELPLIAAGKVDFRKLDIKCMMRNLHLTMEQAMEALEIPIGEQERYRRALEG